MRRRGLAAAVAVALGGSLAFSCGGGGARTAPGAASPTSAPASVPAASTASTAPTGGGPTTSAPPPVTGPPGTGAVATTVASQPPATTATTQVVTGGPRLTISSPTSGQTVSSPFTIAYQVSGNAQGLVLLVFPGDLTGYRDEVALTGAAGTASLDDKALTGRRDLTFVLGGADHTPLTNPEARVVVRNVVIEGGR